MTPLDESDEIAASGADPVAPAEDDGAGQWPASALAASVSGSQLTLNPAEQAMLDALAAGRRAHCGGAALRAQVIRDLVLETYPDRRAGPAGVRIYDAVITGELDLEGCIVDVPLLFFGCRFGTELSASPPILLRDAKLKRLGLYECTIDGGINAERLTLDSSLFMRGAICRGRVRLRGARIGGALTMEEARFSGANTALLLDSAEIGGPWVLRGAKIAGEVRFTGAQIGHGVLLEDAAISHAGIALIGDGAVIDGPLVLRKAAIAGGIQLRGASAKGVVADDARLSGDNFALMGEELSVSAGISMKRVRVEGQIGLSGLHLSGNLDCEGAEIIGKERAIALDGAEISGWCSFVRARLQGSLRLPGARIGDRLLLDAATIESSHCALLAEGATLGQGLVMRRVALTGSLNLMGAAIGGTWLANEAVITAKGRALEADVVRISGNWIMRAARITGSIRFPGADILGQLALTGSSIEASPLAIRADGAHIRGGWFMGRAHIAGLVRFPACRIGNQVRLRGTKITVSAGPALVANGSEIARDVILDKGFSANGAVSFDQTVVKGMLDLKGCSIVSALLLRNGKVSTYNGDDDLVGEYDDVAISLVDARLDRLRMPDDAACRPRGIVDFSRAQIGTFEDFSAAWPPPLALGARTGGPAGANVARGVDESGRDVDHLILDGFAYDHLEHPAGGPEAGGLRVAELRSNWLEAQSAQDLDRHFKPHAWMFLTSRLAAQGYHEDAQRISIARRRRQRRSSSIRPGLRLQSWLLDRFALFGYSPWRTIAWMAAFVLLFGGIWLSAATHCGVADCSDESVFVRTDRGKYASDPAVLAATYPEFHPLAYSFDLFIPLISFGYQDTWRPRLAYGPFAEVRLPDPAALVGRMASGRPAGDAWTRFRVRLTWGGVLYVLSVVEMILGLVLTSLAVTGFTGLLRRDD